MRNAGVWRQHKRRMKCELNGHPSYAKVDAPCPRCSKSRMLSGMMPMFIREIVEKVVEKVTNSEKKG